MVGSLDLINQTGRHDDPYLLRRENGLRSRNVRRSYRVPIAFIPNRYAESREKVTRPDAYVFTRSLSHEPIERVTKPQYSW